MAQADQHLHQSTFLTEKGDDGGRIVMPHNHFNPRDLDQRYPAILVQEQTGADAMEPMVEDPLSSEGERIARDIQQQTRYYGRTMRAVLFAGGADAGSVVSPRVSPAVPLVTTASSTPPNVPNAYREP